EGGGGASADSCSSACDKLISCSLIPVGAKAECGAECSKRGYQYQIDCVNKTACGEIASKCGGISEGGETGGSSGSLPTPDTSKEDCLRACDDINFFDCAPVSKHSECRAACGSASESVRDDFTSCSDSSGVDCPKKAACLDAFLE